MVSHKTRSRTQEAESSVDPESTSKAQSWLGPYPVMKALPTFESVVFRKLRGTVQTDRALMTQEELFKCVKSRREVRRRKRQAQKLKVKKTRRQLVRKQRREQHERNRLNNRARGFLSQKVLQRNMAQNEDADKTRLLTQKISGFSKRKDQAPQLASGTEIDPCLKQDKEDESEGSDTNEQSEDEESDYSADSDNQERAEYQECEEMDYDDASGELVPTPRKWGKWFNAVRKRDEEDEF